MSRALQRGIFLFARRDFCRDRVFSFPIANEELCLRNSCARYVRAVNHNNVEIKIMLSVITLLLVRRELALSANFSLSVIFALLNYARLFATLKRSLRHFSYRILTCPIAHVSAIISTDRPQHRRRREPRKAQETPPGIDRRAKCDLPCHSRPTTCTARLAFARIFHTHAP